MRARGTARPGGNRAHRHPHHPTYTTLAGAELAASTLTFLTGPKHARDIEATGGHRFAPAKSPSDLPYPAEELPSWAECLLPAGYHEGLGVALYAPDRRNVGFLTLLSAAGTGRRGRCGDPSAGSPRCSVAASTRCAPRRPPPASSTEPARAWCSGTGRRPCGDRRRAALRVLPVAPGRSPRTAGARAHHRPGQFRGRVGSPDRDGAGVATWRPARAHTAGAGGPGAADRRAVDRGIARVLVLAQRTVAAHLKHVLAKLSAPTRTLAAVRAEREGLYVPPRPETSPQPA
jgi:hypothetical protein